MSTSGISDGVSAYEIKVKLGDGGSPTEVFTEIGEVVDVGDLGTSWSTYDKTNKQSNRITQQGSALLTLTDIDITFNKISDAMQDRLEALHAQGDAGTANIEYLIPVEDDEPEVYLMKMWVKAFAVGGKNTEGVMGKVSLVIVGNKVLQ